MKFQMFNPVLEKPEEPEIKLPTSIGSLKKQEREAVLRWERNRMGEDHFLPHKFIKRTFEC